MFLNRELNLANLYRSILCSDIAVKIIDEPFVGLEDDENEWAL